VVPLVDAPPTVIDAPPTVMDAPPTIDTTVLMGGL